MRSALKFKIDILAESWIEKKAFLAFESGWKIKLLTHPVNIFDLIFCWYFWYCADWPRRRNGRWWFVFGKMRILSNKNVHGQQAGRTDKEKEFSINFFVERRRRRRRRRVSKKKAFLWMCNSSPRNRKSLFSFRNPKNRFSQE